MWDSILLIIAILTRIISNPAANVFQKKLTKDQDPLLVNFLTYFCLAVICIIIAMKVSWKPLPAEFWIYSILGGMVGAAGNGFLVKALQLGDLSLLGPVNSYKSVVGMIIGIFLLGEYPNVWGFLGVALIIYGSYFVLDTTEERFTRELFKRKEIQFRIYALVLTAVEAVFLKKVILSSSVLIGFFSWCWFGTLFSLLLTLRVFTRQVFTRQVFTRQVFTRQVLGLVLCIGVMQFTTTYVLDHMPVGYALSLFQLSAVISVFLGYKLFDEGNIIRKIIGTLIMVAGSVMILLLKD